MRLARTRGAGQGARGAAVRAAGAVVLGAALAAPVAAQSSVTIYNDGRVLVRRTVSATVPKGASSQQVTLGAIDPASLFSLDSAVAVTGVSYDGAVDEMSVLRRSVGKRLVFRTTSSRSGWLM